MGAGSRARSNCSHRRRELLAGRHTSSCSSFCTQSEDYPRHAGHINLPHNVPGRLSRLCVLEDIEAADNDAFGPNKVS